MSLFNSIRRLFRDKLYFFICLLQLTILISSCSFILIYVTNELTYDSHHKKISSIYRLSSEWKSATSSDRMAITNGKVGLYLKQNYSIINNMARISLIGKDPILTISDQSFSTVDFRRVEPTVFDVFTFDFIHGDRNKALSKPGDLVINRSNAMRFFGTVNCVGRTIKSELETFQITGVIEDLPQNVDLNLNGLIYQSFDQKSWNQFAFYTYVLLKDGIPRQSLKEALEESSRQLFAKNPQYHEDIQIRAEPLAELHFTSGIKMDNPKGNLSSVRLMIMAGLLLFIIVLVNLTNLNIIKSLGRIKKIAVHRILGASRLAVMAGFIRDLTIIWLLSVMIGFVLFDFGRPTFTTLTGIHLTNTHLMRLGLFSLTTLVMIWVSGLVSIEYILKSRPSLALKKFFRPAIPGNSIRKYLVAFQFITASVLMSVFTILFLQQNYLYKKDLGFNPNGLMRLSLNPKSNTRATLINKLKANLGEDKVTAFWKLEMTKDELPFSTLKFNSNNNKSQEVVACDMLVDENYFEVLGIKRISGTRGKLSGNQSFAFVNQTLAKQLTFEPEDVAFEYQWGPGGRVNGVIADYHFRSLHNKIQPLLIAVDPSVKKKWNGLYLKTTAAKAAEIRSVIASEFSEEVEHLAFVNQDLEKHYSKELRILQLLGYFMIVGILLSGLGIYSVLIYLFNYRMFEIGVRKMLGANLSNLISLFGKEFTLISTITLFLSLPIALLIKDRMLESFAYQVDFSWVLLLLPIALLLSVMFLIVIGISIKATRLNASFILRNE